MKIRNKKILALTVLIIVVLQICTSCKKNEKDNATSSEQPKETTTKEIVETSESTTHKPQNVFNPTDYETGITYEQLARTPDNYTLKKVKFNGKVIQVVESSDYDYVQIRLAVNSDYDTILFCQYDKDIVSSRILENDMITIYGVSYGLITYETALGSTVTIPSAVIDKIETNIAEQNTTGNENKPEKQEKIIYQDKNVIITYTGISGKETDYKINYIIENLTDKTLTIQVKEMSINGFMVDPICSIDIAPHKKAIDDMEIWGDDAKNHPMSSVKNIETKFHIWNANDWNDRYDTENIVVFNSKN